MANKIDNLDITEEEERAGLRRLFDLISELPIPPDRTRKVAGYIARLEAQLAALDWREITEKDLPKVGDEVRGRPDSKSVIKHNNPQILAVTESMITLFGWQTEQDELWKEQSWIEFRPINPPAPRSKA